MVVINSLVALAELKRKSEQSTLPTDILLVKTNYNHVWRDFGECLLHSEIRSLSIFDLQHGDIKTVCRRISELSKLRKLLVGGQPGCKYLHMFVFRTPVSICLREFKIYDIEFNSRNLAVLGESLKHNNNLMYFTFRDVRTTGPPYLCPALLNMTRLCDFYSGLQRLNWIEVVFISMSLKKSKSLDHVFFMSDASDSPSWLHLYVAVRRLLSVLERSRTVEECSVPLLFRHPFVRNLGLPC